MLSNSYDEEQRGLKTREQALRESLDERFAKSENTGKFLAIVKKYTDIREITPPILHELIEKIVIHEADSQIAA